MYIYTVIKAILPKLFQISIKFAYEMRESNYVSSTLNLPPLGEGSGLGDGLGEGLGSGLRSFRRGC